MNDTLSRFFDRTPATTRDTCDREQIHLAGTIQKGNGLLVLNSDDHVVVGASANIE